jgi:5-bromo-4-chloroindolyl phosphate hydrolysis protein
VGLLPAIALVVILYLLPIVNILLAIIFLLLIMLVLVGIVMLLSFRARRNAIKKTYKDKVKGEIDTYIREHNLTRSQFDTLAQDLVPEGTPLRGYLSP